MKASKGSGGPLEQQTSSGPDVDAQGFSGNFALSANGRQEAELCMNTPPPGSNPMSSERARDASKGAFVDGPFGGKKPA